MRSDSWRIARHRRALSIHADDHAPYPHRVSEGRIEIHASRSWRKIAAGCHGIAPQAGQRAACVRSLIKTRALSVEVAGLSCLTNLAAGLSQEKLSHEEVLEVGRTICGGFRQAFTSRAKCLVGCAVI